MKVPPELASYQSIVLPSPAAAKLTTPDPHLESLVVPVIVGNALIVPVTKVLTADVQPAAVIASTYTDESAEMLGDQVPPV